MQNFLPEFKQTTQENSFFFQEANETSLISNFDEDCQQ
jgi:hypothetical protein